MLGSMRANKKNQVIIWIILGLLAIGLIGFGTGGPDGATIRSIGQVGQEDIRVNDYARSMNGALTNLSQQLGRSVSITEAETFGLQSTVLDALLEQAALDNETRALGISIGDTAVLERLVQTPGFQNLDGSFDQEAYNFALENAGLSPSDYEDIVRKDGARVLLEAAIASGLQSGHTQAKSLLSFDRETRDFDWIALTPEDLETPIPSPTQAQIQSHYDANPETYTAPLTRDITYVWLNPEALLDKTDINEAQIKEAYDLQHDRFNKPERRSLERLVFETEEAALAARNTLDAGAATFDDLLSERGLTTADVDLGEVAFDEISKTAADVVFATDDTGVVGPVNSALGPSLFRINAILTEDITPLEEARPEIMAELAGDAARRMVSDAITDIDDMLAAGATLEELAKETDMELGTIAFSAETEDGIAAYENFRTIAAKTSLGDFPELHDLADGGVFALRVDTIKDPSIRPLHEIKDRVREDWKAAETLRQLKKVAETVKTSMESGAELDSHTPQSAHRVQRFGYIENTSPNLIRDMFNTQINEARIVADDTGVWVAKLNKINTFDEVSDENQALLRSLNQQLDVQISNDLLGAFAEALQTEAGVTLNQPIITQINTQLTGTAEHGGY